MILFSSSLAKLIKIFSIFVLILVFISLFSASVVKSTLAENIPIFNADHQNKIVIYDNIGSTGNSSLFFGDSLSHALFWENSENNFVFTDNVNLGGNEIINTKLEHNIPTNKTCNFSHSGEIYYNTDNKLSYICSGDSEIWRVLNNTAVQTSGLKAYFEALNKTSISKNETTDILLTGGNFTPNSIFSLDSGATLNYTVINSDSSVTLNVTGGADSATVNIFSDNFFGNNLQFSVQ